MVGLIEEARFEEGAVDIFGIWVRALRVYGRKWVVKRARVKKS